MELIVFSLILAVILVAAILLVTVRPGSTPMEALGEALASGRYAVGDLVARFRRRTPESPSDGEVHAQNSDAIRRRLGMSGVELEPHARRMEEVLASAQARAAKRRQAHSLEGAPGCARLTRDEASRSSLSSRRSW